jgi:hypothetical protein
VNLTKKNRQRRVVTPPTPFEQARDELFQQIMRCEVIGAVPEHQAEWFTETITYFANRYPELKPADVNELRKLGERFVQPPKATVVVDEALDAAVTISANNETEPAVELDHELDAESTESMADVLEAEAVTA